MKPRAPYILRISCSNQTEKRSRSSVVGTSGGKSATIKDTIVEVFGPKCLSSIIEIKTEDPSEDALAFYDIRAPLSDFDDLSLRLRGYVSSCEHGKGRSSADRQFYYINGRPCDPNRISKLVNDLYHQYNKQQVYLCDSLNTLNTPINNVREIFSVSVCGFGYHGP